MGVAVLPRPMPVPNHPDKHGAPAVVTPAADAEYRGDRDRGFDAPPPPALLVCYQPSLFEHVVAEHAGPDITGEHRMASVHPLEDQKGVGVVGGFGIGAPVAAMMVETMVEQGVETFLSVGYAGALDPELGLGDAVVVDRALRDEGTSHHYLTDDRYVAADVGLVDAAESVLADRGLDHHVGPTWTTDAPFRETAVEVADYADEGVLTVEMEVAAVLAVAQYRDVAAGALLTVSDHVGREDWDPQFHEARDHLEALFDHGREVIRAVT